MSTTAAGLVLCVMFFVGAPWAGASPAAEAGADAAAPVVDLRARGNWGGRVKAIALDPARPDLVFAAVGQRVVVLRVVESHGAAEFTELGHVDLGIDLGIEDVTGRGIEDIAYRGDGYVLAAIYSRFVVIDVTDPTAPTIVGDGSASEDWLWYYRASDVQVVGDHAAVLSSSKIYGVDLSDPTDPRSIRGGNVTVAVQSARAFVIRGDFIYAVTGNQGGQLEIHSRGTFPEIGTPAEPIASVPLFGIYNQGHSIAIEGDLVCVATGVGYDEYTLEVYDVSDPRAPTLLWAGVEGGEPSFTSDLAISGGLLFVADEADAFWNSWQASEGLKIFDLATDPTAPTLLGTYKPHGGVFGVTVAGDRAYVLDAGEGLVLLDISDPTDPVFLGNYHSPALMTRSVQDGDLLYITDEYNGISILDVSDADAPKLVGVYQSVGENGFGTRYLDIAVEDGIAYAAVEYWGMDVVDVSDPAAPVHIGLFPMPPGNRCFSVVYGDGIATLGGKVGAVPWIKNLDVSEPSAIVEIGQVIPSGFSPVRMRRAPGGVLYAAMDTTWVAVDNSDPTAPAEMWFVGGGSHDDIAVDAAGDIVCAQNEINNDYSFRVFDGVPAAPAETSVLDVSNRSHYLDIAGDVLFATYYDGQDLIDVGWFDTGSEGFYYGLRLVAFDLSDPASPVVLDAVPVYGSSGWPHVRATPGRVYIADGQREGPTGGLRIYTTLRCPGDVNDDGAADAADLSLLIGAFGSSVPPGSTGDVNGDGIVDAADLSVLVGGFGCAVE